MNSAPRKPSLDDIVPILLFCTAGAILWFALFDRINEVEAMTYYSAGKALLHLHTPFPSLSGPQLAGGHAFVYPLTSAIPFIPLALLPMHLALLLFRLLLIFAWAWSFWLMMGSRGLYIATLLLFATPVIVAFQVGSLEPLMLLGCVLVYRWRDRATIVVVLITLLAVAKLFLIILLLLPLIQRKYRTFLVATLISGVILLVGIGPIPGISSYLEILHRLSALEIGQGWSLAAVIRNFGVGVSATEAIDIIMAVPFLAAYALLYRLGRIRDGGILVALIALALLVSPIEWSHYFLLGALGVIIFQVGPAVAALIAPATWVLLTPDNVMASHAVTYLALYGVVAVVTMVLLRRYRSKQVADTVIENHHPFDIHDQVHGAKAVYACAFYGIALEAFLLLRVIVDGTSRANVAAVAVIVLLLEVALAHSMGSLRLQRFQRTPIASE